MKFSKSFYVTFFIVILTIFICKGHGNAAETSKSVRCSKKDILKARGQFTSLYKSARYSEAIDKLQPYFDSCRDEEKLGELPYWLAADLSLAYFKTDKSERCMEILQGTLEHKENPEGTLDDFAELSDERLVTALRTNALLCAKKGCNILTTSLCYDARMHLVEATLDKGPYNKKNCSIKGYSNGIAVKASKDADQSCLVIAQPLIEVSWSYQEMDKITEMSVNDVCPRMIHVSRTKSGTIITDIIPLPEQAYLNDHSYCCTEPSLEGSEDIPGKFKIESGMVRNCFGGTEQIFLQNIFYWDGSQIKRMEDHSTAIH